MATIRDVAKQAGVSVATVSRVLNNNGYVNDKTRKRIEETIAELKYKPNAVARSLFKKESKTIGLIIPNINNPFFPELARAVEDVTNSLGYTVILCNSDEKIEKEQEYIEILKQKYVDGLIIASNVMQARQVNELSIPVVVIDRSMNADIPSVVLQNREGAKIATRHLKEIGCKKIAHIRGPENIVPSDNRYKGYLDEVQNEPWFSSKLIISGDYHINKSIDVTKKLLLDIPDIDGIFAGNDLMAVGAIKAAEQVGKRVPEDIAIIGFDGIALCEMTSPELTTIAQPIYKMGSTAAKMLIDLLQGKPLNQTNYEFEGKLIKRKSTDKSNES